MSDFQDEYDDVEFEAVVHLGGMVLDRAMELFDYAKCGDDFCIQHSGGYNTIFGGTNRLLWNPITGFHADKKYCSERFIEAMVRSGVSIHGK